MKREDNCPIRLNSLQKKVFHFFNTCSEEFEELLIVPYPTEPLSLWEGDPRSDLGVSRGVLLDIYRLGVSRGVLLDIFRLGVSRGYS